MSLVAQRPPLRCKAMWLKMSPSQIGEDSKDDHDIGVSSVQCRLWKHIRLAINPSGGTFDQSLLEFFRDSAERSWTRPETLRPIRAETFKS